MMLSMAPALPGFEIQEIDQFDSGFVVVATSLEIESPCPTCQQVSTSVHSRYERTPLDLPSSGRLVRLCLQVKRFFCKNSDCNQHVFCQRLPQLLSKYARRTDRTNDQLRHLAFLLGGQLGAMTANQQMMPISASTLLRLIRQTAVKSVQTVKVLGIDDWAQRKRHTYGTILVDLERQQVIDLLPDRSSETLMNWLADHPEVEFVTRDRWRNYADAVSAILPKTIQIADRFHLIRNLADAIKRFFDTRGKQLRDAGRTYAEKKLLIETGKDAKETELTPPSKESWQEVRFKEVKALQAKGTSIREIARQLKIHRKTVRKYFKLDSYPQRSFPAHMQSNVSPYYTYLISRWKSAQPSYKTLHEELVNEFNYTGSYNSVCRAMKQLIQDRSITSRPTVKKLQIPRLSAAAASWLYIQRTERLSNEKQRLRTILTEQSPIIGIVAKLTQWFCKIIRDRLLHQLAPWLKEAEQCPVQELQGLAKSFQQDRKAIEAALQYEFSNGQVEGQVHRLKLIKRQMYGRAKFDLLRLRVLYNSGRTCFHQK